MKQTPRYGPLALAAALVFAAGCAAAPPEEAPEPTELERMRDRSNAFRAFHYTAELTVGAQSVAVEMAWRAPDRALLRYGENTRVLFDGGTVRVFTGGNRYEMDYAGELAKLEERYGVRVPGRRPEPVFILENWAAVLQGRAPRATVAWRKLGARLGWLQGLKRFTREGRAYRWGAIRIELREDGFIEQAKIGFSGRFALKQISFDPPPDSVFEPPPAEKFQDVGARIRPRQSKALEAEYHRWILASDPDDATLRAIVRTDLALRYEPEKMIEIQRTNLKRTLDAYRSGEETVDPAFLKAKVDLERGRAQASVGIMGEKIRSDFERALDRYFRGMDEPPSQDAMRELAERWQAAVDQEVDRQIGKPFESVFDAALNP